MLTHTELVGFGARSLAVAPTTWNPSDKAASSTLSNGNLTNTTASSGYGMVRSIYGATADRFYCEITITNIGAECGVAVANASENISNYLGQTANSWAYLSGGNKANNNSFTAYGASYTNGDIISVLLDRVAGTVEFWKNGASQGIAFSGLSGTVHVACADGSNAGAGAVMTANFGASQFIYAVPGAFFPGLGSPF